MADSRRFALLLGLCEELTDAERIGLIRRIDPRPLTKGRIESRIDDWCRQFGWSPEEMRGRSRSRATAAARARLCRYLSAFGHTSVEIGRALGRDHSTILAAIKS